MPSKVVLYGLASMSTPGILSSANVGQYFVRGVVIADVPNAAAFTVVNNGVTYVQGDRVLLANQTVTSRNGVYDVGLVTAGVAPLTRAPELGTGLRMRTGSVVEVGGECTVLGGSTWKLFFAGSSAVIGTDPLVFWPKSQSFTGALVAGSSIGTFTSAATGNVFLRSTTGSTVFINPVLANTPAATVRYQCLAATRVAGTAGTGAIDLMAAVAAGTINVADISTIEATITNW